MGGILQDLRYALRLLRNAPAFAAIAALTLGLGIGANAAMVGLFDTLLVRPPAGVREPDAMVRVVTERPARLPGRPPQMLDVVSYPQFSALGTRARGFSGVAAYASAPLGVGQGEAVRNEEVILASGDYFPVLGVRAGLGRLLQPDDDRQGSANPVAVLSWDYWRRAYGGDPGVLGRTVRVGDQTLTVVGVAPRRFVGTQLGSPAIWVPLSLATSLGYDESAMLSPHVSWLTVVARLAKGMTREQATAAAQSALLVAEEERATAPPPANGGGNTPGGGMVSIRIQRGGPGGAPSAPPPPPRVQLNGIGGAGQMGGPGPDGGGGPPVQLWYLAVTGAVLLIACANVANLLLARGAYRSHELAVRLSMGATPGRLGRQLLTESAVLALLGGVAGFAVALGIWRILPALISMPPLPSLIDARTLSITLALTLLTVAFFGIAPLLGMRRSDIRTLIGRSAPNMAGKTRGRSVLVIVQLAVSVVLLIGAGLFIRSFQKIRAMDLGYDREGLLEVTADTRGAGWTPERSREFWERAQERVAQLPGVRSASRGANAPYLMRMMMPFIAGEDSPTEPEALTPSSVDFVDEAFFSTMGIRILEGRPFGPADHLGGAPVAIISEALARDRFRGRSPIGQCIRTPRDRQCLEIVGVAANARFGELTDESPEFVYQPLEQAPEAGAEGGVLHVRVDGDPAELASTLRRELKALDGAAVEVRSIDELVRPQLAPWRAAAILLSIFGGMGLLLASVGLYGVVAFLVARRTREIGIRMALGATRGDVLRAILRDASRLVGIGAGVGLLTAAGATRVLRSALYGVSTLDPLVYAATAALLVAIALLAAFSPARRASRVDPMVALRAE
jgi:putative ABC transport system permease protein